MWYWPKDQKVRRVLEHGLKCRGELCVKGM